MVVIERPTYVTVVRQETVASRRTDQVNVVLSSLPLSQLFDVTNMDITLSEGIDALGFCRSGQVAKQVTVEQPFCVTATIKPRDPGVRDLTFPYQFVLLIRRASLWSKVGRLQTH